MEWVCVCGDGVCVCGGVGDEWGVGWVCVCVWVGGCNLVMLRHLSINLFHSFTVNIFAQVLYTSDYENVSAITMIVLYIYHAW